VFALLMPLRVRAADATKGFVASTIITVNGSFCLD
jgi:hypothetical protein